MIEEHGADPERTVRSHAAWRLSGCGRTRTSPKSRAATRPAHIIWGARDPIIPVHHGEHAHQAIPGSRLEIFDGVSHLPQLEAPGRFVAVLERFIEQTEPAQFDASKWRARLQTTADGA